MNHKLTFALILLTLPLFGAGCGDKQTTSSVSGKADTAQADTNESAPSDEKFDTKPSNDDEATATAQSALPEGWKVYRSEKLALSFAYPPDWYVTEDVNLGILLTETPLPQPLPPDVLDVPVVIGVSGESEDMHEKKLRSADPRLVVEAVSAENYSGVRYSSLAPVNDDDEPGIEYRLKYGSKFLGIGVNTNADFHVIQSLLSTLSF